MSISTNKSSPYYGPLKGEIELANGSKILFNAADWTFSHIPIDGCMLKAKETTRPFIMTWDPAKGDCFTAWKVSKDEYGRSPIVDLVQQEELKSRIVHREMLLEDARKLLERYAETFPWEYELKGIKDHLVERIDNLKKETAKKQEETKQTISKQIEEIHQQVREFVEKEYPGYRVTEIDNRSETKYAKPFRSTAHIILEFCVYGVNAECAREIDCDVMVDSEGKMHIKRVTQCGMKG